MRILISGFVVFVIWCFISVWLYVDKVLPALKPPVPEQTIPEVKTNVADSLAQIAESMPKTLMIYFEFDKAEVRTDASTDASLTEIKNWLDKYTSSILSVTGHTDYTGPSDYNQALGMRRAISVRKSFEEKGIPSSRIIVDSKGEDQPIGDNLTKEGRAKNRRSEITIKMQ
jgi:OmpA-OmpF porin, OOP family